MQNQCFGLFMYDTWRPPPQERTTRERQGTKETNKQKITEKKDSPKPLCFLFSSSSFRKSSLCPSPSSSFFFLHFCFAPYFQYFLFVFVSSFSDLTQKPIRFSKTFFLWKGAGPPGKTKQQKRKKGQLRLRLHHRTPLPAISRSGVGTTCFHFALRFHIFCKVVVNKWGSDTHPASYFLYTYIHIHVMAVVGSGRRTNVIFVCIHATLFCLEPVISTMLRVCPAKTEPPFYTPPWSRMRYLYIIAKNSIWFSLSCFHLSRSTLRGFWHCMLVPLAVQQLLVDLRLLLGHDEVGLQSGTILARWAHLDAVELILPHSCLEDTLPQRSARSLQSGLPRTRKKTSDTQLN